MTTLRRTLLAIIALAGFARAPLGAQPVPPNIVIIVSDDQGYADSGRFGTPQPDIQTPNIDSIASNGVRFTNGYASGATCSPTRAGLMTGRYQQRLGFYDTADSRAGLPLVDRDGRAVRTIAEYLKDAHPNYATAAIGKWHLGYELVDGVQVYNPFLRGFDHFYGFLGHGAHDYFDLTAYAGEEFNAIRRNLDILPDENPDKANPIYLTDKLTDEALAFVDDQVDAGKPFFLYLAYNAAHSPSQPPDEPTPFDPVDDTASRARTVRMLASLDANIGRVLAALRAHGIEDDTMVIFHSDNGGARGTFAVNAPLRGFKHDVYEGGIRVPFIVSWPAQLPRNKAFHKPVIVQDLLPTILAAVGAAPPAGVPLDGTNLIPYVLRQQTGPVHPELYWAVHDGGTGTELWAIRKGDWKLLRDTRYAPAPQLFNLATDGGEATDVAAQNPAKVAQLTTLWERWDAQNADDIRPGGGGGD